MADVKTCIPKNVREVVLQGFDLCEGFCTFDDSFIGPNALVRRGEFEPDGAGFEIPFTASITWGKPRPIKQEGRS